MEEFGCGHQGYQWCVRDAVIAQRETPETFSVFWVWQSIKIEDGRQTVPIYVAREVVKQENCRLYLSDDFASHHGRGIGCFMADGLSTACDYKRFVGETRKLSRVRMDFRRRYPSRPLQPGSGFSADSCMFFKCIAQYRWNNQVVWFWVQLDVLPGAYSLVTLTHSHM
jgi:hypothetical protein